MTRPGVLLAVTIGGLLTSSQLLVAPLAHACAEGQLKDTVTGMCWSQSGHRRWAEFRGAMRLRSG
jgi:hypothetical protein